MDLLQRIQRWYTINCNGDWEHENTISITNIDNPGWTVTIDLYDTCLQSAALPYTIVERTTTNWVGYSAEKGVFKGDGGSENLSEILAYFLDTFLPLHLDADCTMEIGLPAVGYEEKLWLIAEGRMVSESTLEITTIEDYGITGNYLWSDNEILEAINKLGSAPLGLKTDFAVGDLIEPTIFQADDNMLRTFLVAPAKK
ncbi:immunity 53 family protein [Hymenobacter caeli]|uniref:Uncharacterized protein n=1 Tax=Hymenobacter caeli TaxID=2735894 RepID=A0ABX2FLL5_9BACT|nr:immunity 53 family protein [Hymenobacter caeli]NRT17481.1 hypothetical protein [Hymenobacter caeli]